MAKDIEGGLVSYDYNKAEIAELAEKYKDITIPEGDKNAYEMVWQGIKECNRRINEVTEWHKAKKRWIIDAGRFYDTQKNNVVAEIEEIKTPLSELKKEADNLEKQRDEERKAAIWEKHIRPIEDAGAMLGNLEAIELADRLTFLESIVFTDEDFQELKGEASTIYIEVRKAVKDALEWRMQQDEKEALQKVEEERLAKQKEEQDRIAAEQAAKQKILDDQLALIAEENRKVQAEKDRIAKEAREALEKKEREELAERIRKEEQEKARIAAEKAETMRKEREAREAKDAQEKAEREAKEKVRLEALRPEKEKCLSYVELLSEIEQPKVEDKNLLVLLKRMADGIELIRKLIQETK